VTGETTHQSRHLRKGHNLLDTGRGSTWWAPGAVGWWIGVLFAVGASFFAIGSAPGFVTAVGKWTDAATYFIGSIFFTSAALLQYLEAANAPGSHAEGKAPRRARLFTWEPFRIEWWACLIQLAGTIYFNVSTFLAVHAAKADPGAAHLVWKPDVFGSICFLIASTLAWVELSGGRLSWSPRELSWDIVALNFVGSVAFGVSAVAAYVVPTTGSDLNAALANMGTFVGAVCFLLAALMLLPERTRHGSDDAAPDREPAINHV